MLYTVNCWNNGISTGFKGSGAVNLALRRPATQSSTQGSSYRASKAVDGTDSFSATGRYDFRPWWKVQLAYPVWVGQVEIHSPTSK